MRGRWAVLRASGLTVALFCALTACRGFGSGPAAEGAPPTGAAVAQSSTQAPASGVSETPSPSSSSTAEPAGEDYRPYTNARFGFTCEVPVDFSPGEDPANGDGLAFTSPDGAAQLICSGSNSLDESAEQGFADSLQAAADDGSTVTYRRLGNDVFTVSGVGADGKIFYEHTLWGAGSSVTVYWTYPSSMKEQLDDAVTRSGKTLQPGDLSIGH